MSARLRHCTVIAMLLAPVAVLAEDDRTVTISGYAHAPCEVVDGAGYRQFVYPRSAQQGGETRVSLSGDGYWSCNTRLDAGIKTCGEAASVNRPVWGIDGEALDACDAMFESMVGECVSHYEGQRPRCSADGGDAGHAGESPQENGYAAALENVLEGNDYRAALEEADRKAEQRLRRQEQERERRAAEARRLEQERIAKRRKEIMAEQEAAAREEQELRELNARLDQYEYERQQLERRRRQPSAWQSFNDMLDDQFNQVIENWDNTTESIPRNTTSSRQPCPPGCYRDGEGWCRRDYYLNGEIVSPVCAADTPATQ